VLVGQTSGEAVITDAVIGDPTSFRWSLLTIP
jgi:hypothetical protein